MTNQKPSPKRSKNEIPKAAEAFPQDDEMSPEEIAFDKLFDEVYEDNKAIKRFLSFFRQADKRMRELAEGQGLALEEAFACIEGVGDPAEYQETLELLEMDPTNDLIQEQYVLVNKLLLALAKYLNAGL